MNVPPSHRIYSSAMRFARVEHVLSRELRFQEHLTDKSVTVTSATGNKATFSRFTVKVINGLIQRNVDPHKTSKLVILQTALAVLEGHMEVSSELPPPIPVPTKITSKPSKTPTKMQVENTNVEAILAHKKSTLSARRETLQKELEQVDQELAACMRAIAALWPETAPERAAEPVMATTHATGPHSDKEIHSRVRRNAIACAKVAVEMVVMKMHDAVTVYRVIDESKIGGRAASFIVEFLANLPTDRRIFSRDGTRYFATERGKYLRGKDEFKTVLATILKDVESADYSIIAQRNATAEEIREAAVNAAQILQLRS